MKTDTEETRVVLRRWNTVADGHDIIALFPDLEWCAGMVTSYMRIGQHGGADPGIVARTIPVDPTSEDAAALLRELRCIGYNPRVVRRLTRGKATR